MSLKRFLLLSIFLFLALGGYAQAPFQINLMVTDRNATVNAIEMGNMLLFFDLKGNIHFDTDDNIKLDYYDRYEGDNIGKLKSIGSLNIKYYDRFDADELHGKVKSIGNVSFTYYDVFDNSELRGKVKSIGGIPLKYYDRFDLNELTGKLRSVGETCVSYYDRFDNRSKTGRVKAVKGNTPKVLVVLSDRLSDDVEVSR